MSIQDLKNSNIVYEITKGTLTSDYTSKIAPHTLQLYWLILESLALTRL